MILAEVAVRVGDQPPDDREHQPTEDEVQREDEQRPAPLRVHQRGEDVLEVLAAPLRHIALDDVAVAVLEDDAFADAASVEAGLAVSVCEKGALE